MHRDVGSEDRRSSLIAKVDKLDEAKFWVINAIVDELSETGDSEVARSFFAWHNDPRLSSLLDLAIRLCSEDLDQLLFTAEDHYSDHLSNDG